MGTPCHLFHTTSTLIFILFFTAVLISVFQIHIQALQTNNLLTWELALDNLGKTVPQI